MKKILYCLLAVVSLASCQSVEEKRQESIKKYLISKGYDIEGLFFAQEDSTFISYLDSTLVSLANTNIDKINETQEAMSEFVKTLEGDSKRIWLKTMTPVQKSAYETVLKKEKGLSDSWSTLKKASSGIDAKLPSESVSVIVEFSSKESSNDEMKGIFYFNDSKSPSVITGMYVIPKGRYSQMIDLIQLATKKEQASLIGLEKEGYDIVPIDEDPTKSKEERAESKKIQQERQFAEERRKREEEEARNNRKLDNQIVKDIRTFISYWNQGCPTQIDEITIGMSASFRNPKIYYNYKLLANRSDYSSYQWEALGSTMKENLKSECQNILQYFVGSQGLSKYEIRRAFNRIGLNWIYVYRDIKGKVLFSIVITPDDLN